MSAFIGPNATVRHGLSLPEAAHLGQTPASTTMNDAFTKPIVVNDLRQVLVLGPIGGRDAMLTVVYGQGEQRRDTYVYSGCFGGTLEMFEDAVVSRKAPDNIHRLAYRIVIEMIRLLAPHRYKMPPAPQEDPAA